MKKTRHQERPVRHQWKRHRKTLVICMRADVAEMVAANSTADRFCADCRERVVTAPSSRRLLAMNPVARVICLECFEAIGGQRVHRAVLAGTPEEVAEEIRGAVLNPWRGRN